MRRPLCAVCLLFSLVILFAFRSSTEAQGLGGSEKDLRIAFDNDKRIRPLMNGEEQPKKDDAKAAQIGARFYIWRATQPRDPKKAPFAVQDEFRKQVNVMLEKNITTMQPRKNRDFINQYFGPALVEASADALNLNVEQNPAIAIQVGMMFDDMARLKQETIHEYLLEIIDVADSAKEKKHIKGKQHDIVRLYALKAMKETFPITPLTAAPGSVKNAQAMMMDVRNVEGLSAYILRSIDTTGLTSQEVEAIRFLRREALASFAQIGAPAVLAINSKKGGEKLDKEEAAIVGKPMVHGEGLAALTLCKVLAGELATLPPSLQEKLEAANGLCNMRFVNTDKSKGPVYNMTDYNPEVAIYLVARTVQEFVSEYDKDYVNFATDKKKVVANVAWRSEAARLSQSLTALADQGGKSAVELRDKAKPILIDIASYKQDVNIRAALRTLVPTLRPASGAVFKTIPAAPIKLP